MTKLSATLALSCLLLTACHKPQAEWTPLFDGKTFEGWTFDALDDAPPDSIFSIRGGVLVVSGADKTKAIIQTAVPYENYELRFQWRWPSEPGNSGCLIHCSGQRFMSIWPQCLEVQLWNGNAGDFVMVGENIDTPATQVPQNIPAGSWQERRRLNLTDDSELPAGQWNQARIVSNNRTVEVYVNGTLVNKGTNATGTKGKICFQAEKADIEFKQIELKRL